MTLDTRFYLLDPVNLKDLRQEVNRLLVENTEDWDPNRTVLADGGYGNRLGQGLCAWLTVSYNRDGSPLVPVELDGVPDEDDIEQVAHWASFGLDTGYSYQDSQGRSCTKLHVDLMISLSLWFHEQGVRWKWRNEYSGEVHTGLDLDGIRKFLSSGSDAEGWFQDLVLPAIQEITRRSESDK